MFYFWVLGRDFTTTTAFDSLSLFLSQQEHPGSTDTRVWKKWGRTKPTAFIGNFQVPPASFSPLQLFRDIVSDGLKMKT